MLSERCRSESQPRCSSGQPAHNTTGVPSASWIHCATCGLRYWWSLRPGTCPAISSSTNGSASSAPNQNRRLKSSSSAEGSIVAAPIASRAMPQIGQSPAALRRICGCIGQVYNAGDSVLGPAAADSGAAAPASQYLSGSARKLARQCSLQKKTVAPACCARHAATRGSTLMPQTGSRNCTGPPATSIPGAHGLRAARLR